MSSTAGSWRVLNQYFLYDNGMDSFLHSIIWPLHVCSWESLNHNLPAWSFYLLFRGTYAEFSLSDSAFYQILFSITRSFRYIICICILRIRSEASFWALQMQLGCQL